MSSIQVEDITIVVERKWIRSMRLAIYPPDGRVVLRIPFYVSESAARAFVQKKWAWIIRNRERVLTRAEQRPQRRFENGELHYLFGKTYPLEIEPIRSGAHSVALADERIVMRCRPTTTAAARETLLYEWYRQQLHEQLDILVARWVKQLGEKQVEWTIRRMRSEWGSCLARKRHLVFNLELARVPIAYIEYVVVHELTHLVVQNHGPAFRALMTQRLPDWISLRRELNRFC